MSDVRELAEALFKIGFMGEVGGVTRLTEAVARRLGPAVLVAQQPTAQTTALMLTRACADQDGGRAALEDAVRELGRGDPATREFVVLSRRLAGVRLLSEEATAALYGILDRITVASPYLQTMTIRLGGVGCLALREVVMRLEYHSDPSLLFAELEEICGRFAAKDTAGDLAAWIDTQAGFLGDEAHRHLRGLRAAFDGSLTRETPVASGDVDDESWMELTVVLANRPRPASCYDAFEWSYEFAEMAPGTLPASRLVDIAAHLRQLPMRSDGFPPLVGFAQFLAYHVTDGAWRSALSRWIQRTRARLRLPDLPVPPPPQPRDCSLVVLVDGDEDFCVRIWLRERGYQTLADAEARSLAELSELVAGAIRKVQPSRTTMSATRALRRIDFVVPHALLQVPFDQWPIAVSATRSVPLGSRYQVTVCCPERRHDGDAYSAWLDRWFWLMQNVNAPEAIQHVRDGGYARVLNQLGAGQHPACVLIEVPDAELDASIDAIFSSGVPVAVWRRRQQPAINHDLGAALAFDAVDKLPPAVRQLRADAMAGGNDVGQTVTLLFDNPDEQLPDDPLDWMDEAV